MKMSRKRNITMKGIRNLTLCLCAVFCLGLGSLTAHAATATVTTDSAKIRSTAGTSGEALAGVKQNDTLDVIGQTQGSDGSTWYQVYVNGSTKGYIRSDLVSVSGDVPTISGGAETAGAQAGEAQAQTTETTATVTESSASAATVTKASVNVRKGPAATDAIVGNVKKDVVVSITGETTGSDGKLWYQVSFESNNKTVSGFILSDLVEVTQTQQLEETPEETEETDGEDAEGGALTGDEINRAISSRILPDGVNLADYPIDESTLESWEDGQYYLLYMLGQDGSNYWYLYDLQNHAYQRADSLSSGEPVETPDNGGFGTTAKIIVIILAIVVVILITIIVLLALKLRENRWDDEDDEEEDENDDYEGGGRVNSRAWKPRNFLRSSDEDDEEEDEEDDEEEEDEDEPPRRPARRAPVRRVPAQPGTRRSAEAPRRAPEEARRRPEGGERRPADRPRQGEAVRRSPEEARRRPEGGERRPADRPRQGEAVRRSPEEARRRPEGGERRPADRPRQGEAVRRSPEETRRRPEGGERRPADRPRQGEAVRRSGEQPRRRPDNEQPPRTSGKSYYEEDDEFEFEFLNMDGKEDL